MRILTADIGGTNSRFGLVEFDGKVGSRSLRLVSSIWLPTSESPDFTGLLQRMGQEAPHIAADLDAAAFALAGPIENGVFCRPPNIGWSVHLDDIRSLLPTSNFFLLNDFVAQAFACNAPELVDARVLYSGTPICHTPVAIIGAGTGLGKCLLLPGLPPTPLPSEGGHAVFPFVGREEFEFADFVGRHTQRRIIGDVVLSGMGLRLLHAFHTGQWLEPAAIASVLTPDHPSERWFARFYGRACQGFVLDTLAQGGLFIAGGIAAKNPNFVVHPEFLEEFRNADAHRKLLEQVPVYLVHGPDAALYGAALYALGRLGLFGPE